MYNGTTNKTPDTMRSPGILTKRDRIERDKNREQDRDMRLAVLSRSASAYLRDQEAR